MPSVWGKELRLERATGLHAIDGRLPALDGFAPLRAARSAVQGGWHAPCAHAAAIHAGRPRDRLRPQGRARLRRLRERAAHAPHACRWRAFGPAPAPAVPCAGRRQPSAGIARHECALPPRFPFFRPSPPPRRGGPPAALAAAGLFAGGEGEGGRGHRTPAVSRRAATNSAGLDPEAGRGHRTPAASTMAALAA